MSPAAEPSIDLWYGDEQRFGALGRPQPLINLLGRVRRPSAVADLVFRVNGGRARPLSMGPDLHRLSLPGAFNAEIPRAELAEGANRIEIQGWTHEGRAFARGATVWQAAPTQWPLPYAIDWSKVCRIQDAVEVVDGRWKLGAGGIRTLDPYYDRVVAVGDVHWRNYEAVLDVTYHRLVAPPRGRSLEGPPYLGHAHASAALRWAGHGDDGFQPRRDWKNLGAILMLRAEAGDPHAGSRWWAHLGRGGGESMEVWGDRRISLDVGRRYRYRARVETVGSGPAARYAGRVWPADEPEPAAWDLVADDPGEPIASGALLLVAHHADVTFGNLQVRPL